jgi:ankyrin repeat protein
MKFRNPFSRKKDWTNSSQDQKFTALKNAINSFSINEFQKLIDQGVDINTCDSYSNENILMYYAANANNLKWTANEIVCFLKANGIDINHLRNKRLKGSTSTFHFAVLQKNYELVEELININAKIEIKDGHGNTPLWTAVMNFKGDTEMTKIINLLIANNASLDSKNNYDKSPRDVIKTIAGGIISGHNNEEWDLTHLLK